MRNEDAGVHQRSTVEGLEDGTEGSMMYNPAWRRVKYNDVEVMGRIML